MVADLYETLLQELSTILKIPRLQPDPNNSCLIKLRNGTEIQIEPDRNSEKIILGIKIAQIPPGAYRINVFKEALKANAQPPPKRGIFAWSKKADQLVIFTMLPLKDLTGEKISDYLYPLAAMATKWREAITAGQVPVVEPVSAGGVHRFSDNIFGIRP